LTADRAALVEARGVSFRRNGREILDQVDISVGLGEVVTLIGPNGAGKTTLVRMLLGLLQPDSGSVHLPSSVCVGYVPQYVHFGPVMPMSVARMMALTRRPARVEIEAALEETGSGHLLEANAADLSGGELRRVLLARALLRSPDLLVLDEPVQGVDYLGEADMYALIAHIVARRGCGVLMVSHDLHIVMAATDRVVCINHHICCSGVPQEVVKDGNFLHLFGSRAGVVTAVYQHDHDHEHGLSGEVSATVRNSHSHAGAMGEQNGSG